MKSRSSREHMDPSFTAKTNWARVCANRLQAFLLTRDPDRRWDANRRETDLISHLNGIALCEKRRRMESRRSHKKRRSAINEIRASVSFCRRDARSTGAPAQMEARRAEKRSINVLLPSPVCVMSRKINSNPRARWNRAQSYNKASIQPNCITTLFPPRNQ